MKQCIHILVILGHAVVSNISEVLDQFCIQAIFKYLTNT